MPVPSAVIAGLALAAVAGAALTAAPLAGGGAAQDPLALAAPAEGAPSGAARDAAQALPLLSAAPDLEAMLALPPEPGGLEAPLILAWPCLDAPGCGDAEPAPQPAPEMASALSITAIPLPAALTLFGVSLSALGLMMHRGRR